MAQDEIEIKPESRAARYPQFPPAKWDITGSWKISRRLPDLINKGTAAGILMKYLWTYLDAQRSAGIQMDDILEGDIIAATWASVRYLHGYSDTENNTSVLSKLVHFRGIMEIK